MGRLIERNVFTFLWLFFLTSILLICLFTFREEYVNEDATFFYCYYAGHYICWPHIFFPRHETGTYFLGPVLDVIFAYAISLVSFVTADFLWRKIFWNKKKNIDTALTGTVGKTSKLAVLQVAIWISKLAGRLLASLSIPFLMSIIDDYIYKIDWKENLQLFETHFHFAGASIAILGCIIGWRFPLIGALMLLSGSISFLVNEGKISFECFFPPFYLATAAFFVTWVLTKLFGRILKKDAG